MSAIIGSLRADLSMRSVAFNKGVDAAQRKLAGLRRNFRRVGRQLQGIGQSMTLGLSAPIAAFGALTVKAGGDFQAAMNKVGAISGATAAELDGLRAAAKEMGATTQFSASQSADALSFLAMAGLNAKQSIDALPGTLQLAASAQMGLADAADIVSNVLSGYGLEVAELARVNDVLVKTFTSANTDLRQLGEAMKYAGPIASAAGVSFEEAAATIGLMGNAGIQASMAGTSLRGAIGRILEPTAKAAKSMKRLGLNFTDSEGRIVSFDKIVAQLAPHADDAGLFMELFGQRAGPAMAALVSQGADSLVKLRGELLNAGGTAERIANAQMEGFNGAMKRLASAFEAVQIAIAESGILDLATRLADGFSSMLTQLAEVNPNLLKLGTIVGGVVLALGPLVLAAGVLTTAFAAVAPAIVSMTVPIAALATVAGVVVSAWQPLTAAIDFLRRNIFLLSPVIGALAIKLSAVLVPAIGAAITGTLGLAAATGGRLVAALRLATLGIKSFRAALISTGIGALIVGAGLLVGEFVKLVEKVGGVKNAFLTLKAVGLEIGERIGLAFGAAGFKIKSDMLKLKASAAEIFIDIAGVAEKPVNAIIGAFVGAVKAIKAGWDSLPAYFGSIGAKAINALIEKVESGVKALVAPINAIAEWLNIEGIKPPNLNGFKLEVKEVEGVAASAAAAFSDAFGQDYTGGFIEGLKDAQTETRTLAIGYGIMSDDMLKAASKPLQSLADLREAQRKLARKTDDTSESAKDLEDALKAATEAGEGLGDGIESGAGRGSSALNRMKSDAARLKDTLNRSLDGFMQSVASGDIVGGFKQVFSDIKKEGVTSFTGILKESFGAGGAGIKGVFKGLGASVKSGFSALGSVFGGAGLGALGSALGSFLPVIGAITSVVSLIKGFSSKKKIGGGLNLGISGGDIAGGTFDTIQKKTFWGLFKRTYDVGQSFDSETLGLFRQQATALRDTVQTAYKSLGISASDAVLNGVSVAVKRIDTQGLSQEQIDGKIQEVFEQYGDALSRAVGGVDLQSAIDLSRVNALLEPLGKAFAGLTSSARINAAAGASSALIKVAGGIEALGAKVSGFYEGFFSEQEKLQVMQRSVARTFRDLGIAVPKTDEAFKSLVLSQNLMTDSGRKAYNALLDIAPVFDSVTDAVGEMSDAMTAAAKAAVAATSAAEKDRDSVLFRLLPENAQIDNLRAKIGAAFGSLGVSVPKTVAGLRDVLSSLDLSNEAGRANFEIIKGLVPDFERVFGYLKEIRGEYSLDASKYATEWEAKLASEVANAGRYSQGQINEQNAELLKQSGLLRDIKEFLRRQADNSDASLAFSQVS